MKKVVFLLIILFGTSVLLKAQSIQMYSDGAINHIGFSHNVKLSFRALDYNSALHAGGWVVTLVSVNADSKGFYHQGKTNRYFSCSELGSFCDPNKFTDVYVNISYQCVNNASKPIWFKNIGQEVTIVVRQKPDTKCSITFDNVRVSNHSDEAAYRERIRAIEYPVEINSSSTSNKTTTSSTNPIIKPAESTKVYINGSTNNTTGTSGNKTQTGSASDTKSGTVNNSSEVSSTGSSEVKTVTDTKTGMPVNTSGNDPLAQYNKTNTSTYNTSTTSSTPKLDKIAAVSTAVTPLLNQWAEQAAANQQAAEQREMQRLEEQDRREAAAAEVRATKQTMVNNRLALLAKYPDGKTPLSSQAKDASEVYYFVYRCVQAANPETNAAPLFVSNVFALSKYSDGTWPFKASLMQKISKANQGLEHILSGYYLTKNEAELKRQNFLDGAKGNAFSVSNITYENKSSAAATSSTDEWGNPIKGAELKTNTEPVKNNDADFWGNPVKKGTQQTTTPAKKETPGSKVDFWGDPVKE